MSSTGRKGRKREKFDQYPTPEWAISRYAEARTDWVDMVAAGADQWTEPCCGEGAIVRTLRLHWLFTKMKLFPSFHLFDIDSKYESAMTNLASNSNDCTSQVMSFLDCDVPEKFFDVAITNPPYDIAQDIAEACFLSARETNLLLRINFLGAARRHSFYRTYGTPDMFVLPDRPGFVGEGTDSTEYAWFRWNEDILEHRRPGQVFILDLTPKSVRMAEKKLRPAARQDLK